MSIATVRAAIGTALGTISGLNVVSRVPDQITPPMAVVYRKAIDYDLDMTAGGSTYHYGISVYAQRTAEAAAQDLLDTLCEPTGATSVRVAIEGNAALDALVDYATVKSASEVQQVTIGQLEYLAVDFVVEVVL